ncbi:T-box transcription factor TBX22 [Ornithorhynchus anatinus]|uniref:T-box transcription factor 22 n=1 Tax=Ornithorhynchus anatinus TaxID=9258 RepID=A0A6I8NYP1_ORNAN|nr:T-box transcription factor TBX22 [Ornithorhynchus anatinus]
MALSSRAHAFSVEALVGKGSKRKLSQELVREPVRELELEARRDHSLESQGEEEERPKAEDSTAAVASGGEEREDIQVELQGSELWKRFYEIGTEMIITKAGRRMFPSVRVRVKGLDPGKQYCIAIDVVPVDSKRYRYVYHSSQWMVAGNTDHSSITPRLYLHPDSPCSGETWARQVISFDRVKLTNNEMDDKGHIILQSMHKYKPRVHVIAQDRRFDCSQAQALPAQGVKTFSFQETEFTTVTAYQNQQITKLKIDRNPFAKGFRDPGRNRGVLDGMMDGYPWRPHLSLDFKPFGADPSGGSGPPSPGPSSDGSPSPLASLRSPSCSPPAFALPSGKLGLACPDGYVPGGPLPLCYNLCPAGPLLPPPALAPAGPDEPSPAAPSAFPLDLAGVPPALDLAAFKAAPAPARGTLGCLAHPPLGLYCYGFPAPPTLLGASSPFRPHGLLPGPWPDGRGHLAHWPATMSHCL